MTNGSSIRKSHEAKIPPYKQKALMKKIEHWEKKGYVGDGPISMTKTEAKVRAEMLREWGYKARPLKGHFTLYTVMRTTKKEKSKK
jgi:hypothetical protein